MSEGRGEAHREECQGEGGEQRIAALHREDAWRETEGWAGREEGGRGEESDGTNHSDGVQGFGMVTMVHTVDGSMSSVWS